MLLFFLSTFGRSLFPSVQSTPQARWVHTSGYFFPFPTRFFAHQPTRKEGERPTRMFFTLPCSHPLLLPHVTAPPTPHPPPFLPLCRRRSWYFPTTPPYPRP